MRETAPQAPTVPCQSRTACQVTGHCQVRPLSAFTHRSLLGRGSGSGHRSLYRRSGRCQSDPATLTIVFSAESQAGGAQTTLYDIQKRQSYLNFEKFHVQIGTLSLEFEVRPLYVKG